MNFDNWPSMINTLFKVLPECHRHHARSSHFYSFLAPIIRNYIEKEFGDGDAQEKNFSPFVNIRWPYFNMGAVDSLNSFDLDELIIYAYYNLHRDSYSNVADLGANLGFHSILLSSCRFNVRSFEPDPDHLMAFKKNLSLNNCKYVKLIEAAVPDQDGWAQFTRVKGNTTSSHLSGAKENPYGQLDYFDVPTVSFLPVLDWADLIKMGVEGYEANLLTLTNGGHWENTDAIVEVGTEANARIICDHFLKIGVNIFSQKIGWNRVSDLNDCPFSYKEGSIFISRKGDMGW